MAFEHVSDLGSRKAARCSPKGKQNFVCDRVAHVVAEDEARGILGVSPYFECGFQVWPLDLTGTFEQRIDAREPHYLCLGSGSHRPE
jgi:hypothetical protein